MTAARTGLLLAVLLLGCQPRPDHDALRQEILALHTAAIEAHLEGDVDFFTRDLSDDYFSAGPDGIFHPSEEEIAAMFSGYLGSTTFSRYEDVTEPIVGVSDDGSMAWALVQVDVEGVRVGDDGAERDLAFACTWITLYDRAQKGWTRRGVVSLC